jgi:FkbM family methyltransferase
MTERAPVWVDVASAVIRRLPFGRYRSVAYLTGWYRRPFVTSFPDTMGGARFIADLRDSICSEVCFTGKYEPQETALIQQLLSPGMSFMDVGANWGYFTLVAAGRVGSAGKIVSLEPDPRIYQRLNSNIIENGLANVTALNVAAAAENGSIMMTGYDEAGTNWGLSRVAANGSASGSDFEVAAVTLDDLVTKYFPSGVDLIKMDIEGAEDLALRGLAKCLARGACRKILLELHPALLEARGSSCAKALAPLLESGYEIFRIDHSPAMTRAAAYAQPRKPEELLSRLQNTAELDSWPHLLAVAPEISIDHPNTGKVRSS